MALCLTIIRQAGQGTDAENERRDLRAELLKAEAAHYAKKNGGETIEDEDTAAVITSETPKRTLEGLDDEGATEEADREAKRRKILEEAREIDAESESESSESSDSSDDEDDEEDETAELMRELEKIKKERAEAKAKEEAAREAEEQEQREFDIARGNPLLNPKDFTVKRRWDDDVVFKNQARGTEDRNKKKEFVNDLLRSDFHKRFMVSCTNTFTLHMSASLPAT